MARYTGPKTKLSRKVGEDLGLKTNALKTARRLNVRPGQHGAKGRRKVSDYGTQLMEKQKVKFLYGILEKQLLRIYTDASKNPTATGTALLSLLERRLDNVVYRMGFGSTRAEARQLVRHKAIMVLPKGDASKATVINIPSYTVEPGDVVAVRERSKEQTRIIDALRVLEGIGFPEWVEVDVANKSGTFKRVPDRSELPTEINEQLVVELYSK